MTSVSINKQIYAKLQVKGATTLFINTVDTATCFSKPTQLWLLYIRCDRRHVYYSVMCWDCLGINTV